MSCPTGGHCWQLCVCKGGCGWEPLLLGEVSQVELGLGPLVFPVPSRGGPWVLWVVTHILHIPCVEKGNRGPEWLRTLSRIIELVGDSVLITWNQGSVMTPSQYVRPGLCLH